MAISIPMVPYASNKGNGEKKIGIEQPQRQVFRKCIRVLHDTLTFSPNSFTELGNRGQPRDSHTPSE